MKSRRIVLVLAACAALGHGQAQSTESGLSLQLSPGVSFPVGRDTDAFKFGGSASLLARLPVFSLLSLEAGGNYSIVPLKVAEGEEVDKANLTLISPLAGFGVSYELFKRFFVGAYVHGGYYFASLNVDVEEDKGNHPLLEAGAGVSYRLHPRLSFDLGLSYRNFTGLYNDLVLALGTAYHFKSRTGAGGILPSQLKPYKELKIESINLQPVFPVFYKYYDDHPLGSIVIRNTGKIPLEEIKVSLFVNQYMDNPNLCRELEFLKGDSEAEIDLFALFNDRVLGISESTKVQANITVEVLVAGEPYGNETVETLRMHDRNAVTWTDDRKAAAFVTMKDPTVLKFAKNITSMVKDKASRAINPNLRTAIAFHEALALFGINYVIDPTTPYKELSRDAMAIDYLQFPNQTLEYKAGDCDDLSILYSALLESVGIPTAFITIPGHIYMAFALGLGPEEAAKQFLKPENLIFMNNESWVPVEVTRIDGGFMQAWEIGAKQWREQSAKSQAGFLPIHEAWELYEPVGFSGEVGALALPAEDTVVSAYLQEVMKFIEAELYPRVSRLEQQIEDSGENPRYINSLGVLYARYGLSDKAAQEFQRILRREEYLPALINMGNLAFLDGDLNRALSYYEQAYKRQPNNSTVVLSLAKVNHELANYGEVNRLYGLLKKQEPELAERYTYLDLKAADETARASEAQRMKDVMIWEE